MNFWDDLSTRTQIKNFIDSRINDSDSIKYASKSSGYYNIFFQMNKNWVIGNNIETCMILESSSSERPIIIPLIKIEVVNIELEGKKTETEDRTYTVYGNNQQFFINETAVPNISYKSNYTSPFIVERPAVTDNLSLNSVQNLTFKYSWQFSGSIYMNVNDVLYLPSPGDLGSFIYDIVKIDDEVFEKNRHLFRGII